ncbi:MAG: hypothetical protein ACOCSE_00345 [Chitinivibrionales bacterium]
MEGNEGYGLNRRFDALAAVSLMFACILPGLCGDNGAGPFLRGSSEGSEYLIKRDVTSIKSDFDIPEAYKRYITPEFSIEIYYNRDSVGEKGDGLGHDDSLEYQYMRDAQKSGEYKGGYSEIPDFIERLGLALDSSWKKIFIETGFKPPQGYRDSAHDSKNYKVIVKRMDRRHFGAVYPAGRVENGQGYRSIIYINSDPALDSVPDKHPKGESGLMITAAHELFHAAEYGYARKVNRRYRMDDIPSSLFEGAAMAMEEIVFSDRDVYTDHTKGFFRDPEGFRVFGKGGDIGSGYSNALMVLFISSKTDSGIRIIRDLFKRNSQEEAAFEDLIEYAFEKSGESWDRVLTDFFTESYFTSDRSDPEYFIDDSRLMDKWDPEPDSSGRPDPLIKAIPPQSAAIFYIKVQDTLCSGAETLRVTCKKESKSGIGVGIISEGAGNNSSVEGILYPDEWKGKEGSLLIKGQGVYTVAVVVAVNTGWRHSNRVAVEACIEADTEQK